MANRDILKKVATVLLPLLIVIFAAMLRLLPHAPNFTPIAAIALFSGTYLDKKYALVLPLAAMLISDFFLGFHQSLVYVYGAFIITGLLGMYLKHHKSVKNVLLATIGSSLLFFLITNVNYWLPYSLYPKTFAGQIQAYYYALPFFRNTLLGDLFYTTLLFGGYEMAQAVFGLKQIPTKH